MGGRRGFDMNNALPKQVMLMISIVARGKGKRLIDTLSEREVRFCFQSVGSGTAPTEMMDVFGLGSNDKDIIFSFAPEATVKEMIAESGNSLGTSYEYGGLMMVLRLSSVNRLVAEMVSHGLPVDLGKGVDTKMKNEHKHNLIVITVAQGYTDAVMQTAKKAGATGGTVIRGRLAESEKLKELADIDIGDEREMILIMAPDTVSGQIMDEVNKEFGLRTEAHGIMCTVPIEKAYKI